MSSIAVRNFDDNDEFVTAIRGSTAEITETGSGRLAAKLVRIDLHRLWTQGFVESLPRVMHASYLPGRAAILFRTEPGPAMVHSGMELTPTNIMILRDAPEFYYRTSGPSRLGTMSLSVEDMTSASVMAGLDLKVPRDTALTTPPATAMANLQRLYAAMGDLAEDAPALLAVPEAARSLEQALIEALIHCLCGEVHERTATRWRHAAIMRRFHRVVEEHVDQPLYLPELCAAVGASERSLRECCEEHLGMGPKRFLVLHRMHLARRALKESNRDTSTVTEIAASFGFWQFGRFAVGYKALFGETPSATLRQSV